MGQKNVFLAHPVDIWVGMVPSELAGDPAENRQADFFTQSSQTPRRWSGAQWCILPSWSRQVHDFGMPCAQASRSRKSVWSYISAWQGWWRLNGATVWTHSHFKLVRSPLLFSFSETNRKAATCSTRNGTDSSHITCIMYCKNLCFTRD